MSPGIDDIQCRTPSETMTFSPSQRRVDSTPTAPSSHPTTAPSPTSSETRKKTEELAGTAQTMPQSQNIPVAESRGDFPKSQHADPQTNPSSSSGLRSSSSADANVALRQTALTRSQSEYSLASSSSSSTRFDSSMSPASAMDRSNSSTSIGSAWSNSCAPIDEGPYHHHASPSTSENVYSPSPAVMALIRQGAGNKNGRSRSATSASASSIRPSRRSTKLSEYV